MSGASAFVAHGLQLALAAVFVTASHSKLRRPRSFVDAVIGYQLLPRRVAEVTAYCLMAVESFLAVALLSGKAVTVANVLAIALLAVFFAAVGINLRRGRKVRCGCFGQREVVSSRTLGRIALVFATAVGLLGVRVSTGTAPFDPVVLATGGWNDLTHGLEATVAAAFVLLLGCWILDLPRLVKLLRGLLPAPVRGHAETSDR